MHVGHLRSTVIGDALNRMLSYKGHRVVPENHIGDWGTPFGMLIEHLIDSGLDSEAHHINLSTFYSDARAKFDNDSDFASRSRARVVRMQSSEPETIELWQMLVDRSLIHFNEVYQRMGFCLPTTISQVNRSTNQHCQALLTNSQSVVYSRKAMERKWSTSMVGKIERGNLFH